MGIFGKLFGRAEKSQSALAQVQALGGKLIVDGYRRLAGQLGTAPTSKTSDEEIIEMYKKVGTAFHLASERRGERLSAGVKNSIVFKFLQVKEMLGADMVDAHLKYEVEKYLQSGLRDEYNQELKLF